MMNLSTLETFLRIVELGGIAKAARALGISPSRATQHLQALEQELGARLLDRTTRKIALTEAGAATLPHVRRMLDAWRAAGDSAASLQEVPRGRLKLSVPVSYGVRRLSTTIAAYLAAYPEVTIEAVSDDRRIDLLAEGFDLAIRVGVLPDSGLIAQKLAPSPLILCAAPDFIERSGEPATVEDLRNLPCLEYGLRAHPGRWPITDSNGVTAEVEVTGPLTATSGEILRDAAMAGLGIVLTPEFIVEDDLAAARLIRVLPDHRGPDAAVYAVRPPGPYLPAKTRSFIDFAVERLSAHTSSPTFFDLPSAR
jgi:DNA-binding transcriptional LysR family regulator